MDRLEEIFRLQTELNDKVFRKQDIRGPDGNVLSMAALQASLARGELGPNGLANQWLRNYLKALREEADELDRELLWKWWSKDTLDLQNIRVEIVDLLHFLVSLAMAAGLTAEEFHRLYVKKGEVNRQRQEQGYSRATKDEADNRTVV